MNQINSKTLMPQITQIYTDFLHRLKTTDGSFLICEN